MGNFDIKSIRYILAVIVIAIIFICIIANAYKYLPENNQNSQVKETNVRNEKFIPDNHREEKPDIKIDFEKYRNDKESEDYDKSVKLPKKTKKHKSVNKNSNKSEEDVSNLPETDKPDIFEKAKNLKADKKYESAIIEYLNIADMASDDEIKAQCYDEVATMYAVMRRFNQALLYAQKSCNLKPTGERTILLSRIYYHSGQEIKAEEKIQAMLKKGFEEE